MNKFLFFAVLLFPQFLKAQTRDSTMAVTSLSQDTFYMIHENVPKSRFWGNSWQTTAGYQFNGGHEVNLGVGRTFGNTYVSGGGFNLNMRSWGVTYHYLNRKGIELNTLGIYGERSNFFIPPLTGRLSYFMDINSNTHYIRPELGINFFVADLLYSYSIKCIGSKNHFGHGVTLRLKYYINAGKWQKNYPNRC